MEKEVEASRGIEAGKGGGRVSTVIITTIIVVIIITFELKTDTVVDASNKSDEDTGLT